MFLSRGEFSKGVVKAIKGKKLEVYFSKSTFEELQKVIKYKRVQENLDFAKLSKIIADLKYACIFLEPKEKIAFDRDTNDAQFLELIVISKANYLVSSDKDLLELENFEETKIITLEKFRQIWEYF